GKKYQFRHVSSYAGVTFRCLRAKLKSHIVDLIRTFTFRNSKQTYTGIPIMVANMDTVGTFEMAKVMTKVSADFHLSLQKQGNHLFGDRMSCSKSITYFIYVHWELGCKGNCCDKIKNRMVKT
uniref:IMP dehydrogenase/GMP reductase domain-containing protein n=1 Tax=Gopherus agassizii TaxID=38772 RepID=A0A452H087_9SAUR